MSSAERREPSSGHSRKERRGGQTKESGVRGLASSSLPGEINEVFNTGNGVAPKGKVASVSGRAACKIENGAAASGDNYVPAETELTISSETHQQISTFANGETVIVKEESDDQWHSKKQQAGQQSHEQAHHATIKMQGDDQGKQSNVLHPENDPPERHKTEATTISDAELAWRLHQELNASATLLRTRARRQQTGDASGNSAAHETAIKGAKAKASNIKKEKSPKKKDKLQDKKQKKTQSKPVVSEKGGKNRRRENKSSGKNLENKNIDIDNTEVILSSTQRTTDTRENDKKKKNVGSKDTDANGSTLGKPRSRKGRPQAATDVGISNLSPEKQRKTLKTVKIPKLPMVFHNQKWYRTRVLDETNEQIRVEFTGFEHLLPAVWLTKSSDRIWFGSYRGKDWKYLGEGAWEPKPSIKNRVVSNDMILSDWKMVESKSDTNFAGTVMDIKVPEDEGNVSNGQSKKYKKEGLYRGKISANSDKDKVLEHEIIAQGRSKKLTTKSQNNARNTKKKRDASSMNGKTLVESAASSGASDKIKTENPQKKQRRSQNSDSNDAQNKAEVKALGKHHSPDSNAKHLVENKKSSSNHKGKIKNRNKLNDVSPNKAYGMEEETIEGSIRQEPGCVWVNENEMATSMHSNPLKKSGRNGSAAELALTAVVAMESFEMMKGEKSMLQGIDLIHKLRGRVNSSTSEKPFTYDSIESNDLVVQPNDRNGFTEPSGTKKKKKRLNSKGLHHSIPNNEYFQENDLIMGESADLRKTENYGRLGDAAHRNSEPRSDPNLREQQFSEHIGSVRRRRKPAISSPSPTDIGIGADPQELTALAALAEMPSPHFEEVSLKETAGSTTCEKLNPKNSSKQTGLALKAPLAAQAAAELAVIQHGKRGAISSKSSSGGNKRQRLNSEGFDASDGGSEHRKLEMKSTYSTASMLRGSRKNGRIINSMNISEKQKKGCPKFGIDSLTSAQQMFGRLMGALAARLGKDHGRLLSIAKGSEYYAQLKNLQKQVESASLGHSSRTKLQNRDRLSKFVKSNCGPCSTDGSSSIQLFDCQWTKHHWVASVSSGLPTILSLPSEAFAVRVGDKSSNDALGKKPMEMLQQAEGVERPAELGSGKPQFLAEDCNESLVPSKASKCGINSTSNNSSESTPPIQEVKSGNKQKRLDETDCRVNFAEVEDKQSLGITLKQEGGSHDVAELLGCLSKSPVPLFC